MLFLEIHEALENKGMICMNTIVLQSFKTSALEGRAFGYKSETM